MGRYSPSADTVALLIECQAKQSQLSAQEKEYTRVISRLQCLEVCSATQVIFERYISGAITLQDLDNAIEDYVSHKNPTSSV